MIIGQFFEIMDVFYLVDFLADLRGKRGILKSGIKGGQGRFSRLR